MIDIITFILFFPYIFFSIMQVPRLYFSGDELGAYRASGQAKGFALMSFMLGSMLLITVAILLVNILNLGL